MSHTQVDFINSRIFHVANEAVIARGSNTLLALLQTEVFGNLQHAIRYLAGAQGRLLDVKVSHILTHTHAYTLTRTRMHTRT